MTDTTNRKTPDVQEYLNLAKDINIHDQMTDDEKITAQKSIDVARQYLIDCFGEGEDMDVEGLTKFQQEVTAAAEKEIAEEATKEDSNESTEVQEATTDSETTN